MKKLLLLFFLTMFSLSGFSQEFSNPHIGNYSLRPNDKISYGFTTAIIESEKLTLKNREEIVQVFEIIGYTELKGFRIVQIYPEVPAESREKVTMNAKTDLTEDGALHVLIEGNGNNGEYYFDPLH
ncbi:MAG: hypothetical protein EP305_08220 [Bacteroidetes bacterium]|nr:MAG: hypothetical protein EP305_08220 [Bacteroidota bacterium]